MKIGIVGFCNLSIMQYLYKYTNALDGENIDYDVIYWNRFGVKEDIGFRGNAIAYEVPLNTFQPFYKKISAFLGYARFMRRIIRQRKYDKLIVLTTQTAVALGDVLLCKYRGRYIFDYRDVTKEKSTKAYAALVRSLINRSAVTMMSSKGFLRELQMEDTPKVQIVHNTYRTPEETPRKVRISQQLPLRISFWGMVRPLGYNQRLCDRFGNDPRFTLSYHGIGACEKLEAYCREKGYRNITFSGRYALSDVEKFADETDILHCSYQNDITMRSAMPVKAYDAIEYRFPVLITKDSYLSEFMQGAAGCCAVDAQSDEKLADTVYHWYCGLDAEAVEAGYTRLEEQIRQDDVAFEQRCICFCQE